MPRIFTRVVLLVNSKYKNKNRCTGGRGNKMSGRGLPINKERTNLGDTQEDWSPHSTQPMRKWGRGLHARDKMLCVRTLGAPANPGLEDPH